RADVLRRFARGWDYFARIYRPLADDWVVYDNSGESPKLLTGWEPVRAKKAESFVRSVGRGLRLAARTARGRARSGHSALRLGERQGRGQGTLSSAHKH